MFAAFAAGAKLGTLLYEHGGLGVSRWRRRSRRFGAALTGFGYSLVFPALGVEAVRRAPAESGGVAMGAYTACLDIALRVSGPVLGAMASRTGLSAVFFVSAVVVLSAAVVSWPLSA